ncbi:LanC-like protein 2 [Echinococcus granulosus]|uniref:Lanc protein n=1 Tax=Echinococcus granulosus TaxID=6210 RepID=A0A068WHL9_ECHGR|nr:LanC-like protein 2 [Echinococcus granulosus]CDS17944.1 lanc protein [Echinococcus granulosus]
MPSYYRNPFIEGSESLPSEDDVGKTIRDKCISAISNLCRYMNDQIDSINWRDLSIYTGVSGILFVGLKLQRDHELTENADVCRFIQTVNEFIDKAYKRRSKSRLSERISVFTSDYTAPCLVMALSKASNASKAFMGFSRCAKYAEYEIPDEALYGRVGYLAGILTLLDNGHQIDEDDVRKIVEKVLHEGRSLSEKVASRPGMYSELMKGIGKPPICPPLMFMWHDKFYLGAAHGFAGILHILLRTHEKLPNALPKYALETLILPTVTWLARLQLSSGNWPSSLGSSIGQDRLVQWCHGAPGIVPLLLCAYKLTGEEDYLKRAERGGEVIWERGLLTKGCGLCHGSAGSGYALLSLYQHTGNTKYLQMAGAVALWCTDYFKHAERTPDRPLSLFEGLAGAIAFLADMRHPEKGEFPLLH